MGGVAVAAPAAAIRSAETSSFRLTLLLCSELIAVAVLRIPYDLGFSAFALGDRGSWLAVISLVERGYRPAIDFGYPYGLLPIWLSAAWFGMTGLTPRAFQLASVMLTLTMAWAAARMIRALRLPFAATIMLIIALPFGVQSSYPSLAHGLEAALLCNAIAEQSAGRERWALALAAAACFAKPSMGYVYGFVLIVLLIADLHRRSLRLRDSRYWQELAHRLWPAALVAVSLSAILGGTYGLAALASTLLPLTGIKDYVAFDFGFFRGVGRYFWSGTPVLFYFGSVIAFWFAATFWLTIWGLVSLGRLLRGAAPAGRRRDELVASAALLHILFVVMFFAGPSSWSYYSYILVLGAAACCTADRVRLAGTSILAALAATGQTSSRVQDIANWKIRTPSAITANLWATAEQRNDWQAALGAIDGNRALMLSSQGCAPLLFSRLERNRFAYLTPGIATSRDLERALDAIAATPFVIVVVESNYGWGLRLIPQVQAQLAHDPIIFKNDYFAVYRRAPG